MINVDGKFADRVKEYLRLKAEMEEKRSRMDEISAELEEECLKLMLDRLVKSCLIKDGEGNGVLVTKPVSLDVRDMEAFGKCFSQDVLERNVKRSEKVTYKLSAPFSRMIESVCMGDYYTESDLESFLTDTFKGVEKSKISLLVKSLKGNYLTDSKLLNNVLGPGEYDEELYFIHCIKNWEAIVGYFPKGVRKEDLEEVCRIVDASETLKVEPRSMN